MKSDIDLLEMYRDEKSLVIGAVGIRTGLEAFPSFKEWKLEYMKEYAETHDMSNPLSMEEAVNALEKELNESGDDLLDEEEVTSSLTSADEERIMAMLNDSPETPNEENEMTEEIAVTGATNTENPIPGAPPKKTKVRSTSTPTEPAAPKPPSMAKEAQKVFDRLYPKVLEGKKARKDVIAEFVEKVGLTKAGANTYYQNMKKKFTAAS